MRGNRRDFLKTTSIAAGTLAAAHMLAPALHAEGNDTIKVGIIGCGGRGSGAGENVLNSAKGVEIVALGDYAPGKAANLAGRLAKFVQKQDEPASGFGNKATVKAENCYDGIDAFEKVINTPGVNYIILATPPGFRPQHLQAAVAAGKNIFTEKPVAVDGTGLRKCMTAYDDAKKKNLFIVAGTQRRHHAGYLETMKHIHGGDIGDIVGGRCYWNQGNIWFRKRGDGMTDLDYQIHNWYHFLWLCGDHICEQHVHNIDVINWATGKLPVKAVGMGGRVYPCKDPNVDGHIFNHFAVDFEYPDGVHILSMCRQINGTATSVSEALVGTKGMCQVNAHTINGKRVAVRGKTTDPYVQEHTDLIECIRKGTPINELKTVTESTASAILGRTACYTGKEVTFDDVMKSKMDTFPTKFSKDMMLPVSPVPQQGTTEIS